MSIIIGSSRNNIWITHDSIQYLPRAEESKFGRTYYLSNKLLLSDCRTYDLITKEHSPEPPDELRNRDIIGTYKNLLIENTMNQIRLITMDGQVIHTHEYKYAVTKHNAFVHTFDNFSIIEHNDEREHTHISDFGMTTYSVLSYDPVCGPKPFYYNNKIVYMKDFVCEESSDIKGNICTYIKYLDGTLCYEIKNGVIVGFGKNYALIQDPIYAHCYKITNVDSRAVKETLDAYSIMWYSDALFSIEKFSHSIKLCRKDDFGLVFEAIKKCGVNPLVKCGHYNCVYCVLSHSIIHNVGDITMSEAPYQPDVLTIIKNDLLSFMSKDLVSIICNYLTS